MISAILSCQQGINRLIDRILGIYVKGIYISLLVIASLSFACSSPSPEGGANHLTTKVYHPPINKNSMKLGAFSISLSVKDLAVSKAFYENFGFEVLGGSMEQNYLIMKNENALIGLFQGMFEGNILTFNPGWDENGKNIESFDDIRNIQQHLKTQGVQLMSEADESTTGPASLMLTDPDGNLIMLDQHR